MGFRFRRRLRLAPGLRLNFSKTGASLSVGARGATLNLGRRGARATIGLPGSGISYSSELGAASKDKAASAKAGFGRGIAAVAVLFALGWIVYSCTMQ